jgi:hypothetical protein
MTTTISGSSGIVFPDLTTMQTGQQAVKAWVNFNGTGTVSIRAGYNVSSITDNGQGDYTVNFATAMVDRHYALSLSRVIYNTAYPRTIGPNDESVNTAESARFVTGYTLSDGVGQAEDAPLVYAAFFR